MNEYRIKAELPAIKKTCDSPWLTQGADDFRRTEYEQEEKKHHRIERAYGSFVRWLLTPGIRTETRSQPTTKTGCSVPSPEIRENKTEIDRDQGVLASCR